MLIVYEVYNLRDKANFYLLPESITIEMNKIKQK